MRNKIKLRKKTGGSFKRGRGPSPHIRRGDADIKERCEMADYQHGNVVSGGI